MQDYAALKAKCKAEGTKFVDPVFDPDTMDVLGKTSKGRPAFAMPIESWRRPQVLSTISIIKYINQFFYLTIGRSHT